MRYIVVERSNGYCGSEVTEYYAFSDDTSDAYIDRFIEEGMYDYAEDYEYLVKAWDEDWESEADRHDYYVNCYFSWREATEEEIEDEEFYAVQTKPPLRWFIFYTI